MVGVKDIRFKEVPRGSEAGSMATLWIPPEDEGKLTEIAYIPIGKGAPSVDSLSLPLRQLHGNEKGLDIYGRLTALELNRVISDETVHFVLFKLKEDSRAFDSPFAVLFTWFDFLVVEDFFFSKFYSRTRLWYIGNLLSGYGFEESAKAKLITYATKLHTDYQDEIDKSGPKEYSL